MTTSKERSSEAGAANESKDTTKRAEQAVQNAAAEIESLGAKATAAGAAALEDAQEIAGDLAPKAKAAVRDAAEAGREGAADAIDRAAQSLEDRAEGAGVVPEKAAEYAADSMHAAAGYLKDRDTAEIVDEAEQYVKAHPMRSVAMAVVAGFFIGRMLR